MKEQISPHRTRHRETKDLAFAAWAHLNGLSILKADETRRTHANEYRFIFDDPNGVWDQLHVDFANSEALKFDHSVRALKKLCKRNTGG